jgi:hypothetical protein
MALSTAQFADYPASAGSPFSTGTGGWRHRGLVVFQQPRRNVQRAGLLRRCVNEAIQVHAIRGVRTLAAACGSLSYTSGPRNGLLNNPNFDSNIGGPGRFYGRTRLPIGHSWPEQ